MIPLIFIGLVTLILVILVYWIISSSNSDNEHWQGQTGKFRFESAGELFKYVDSDWERDLLILESYPKYLLISWNISSRKWEQFQQQFGTNLSSDNLLIRLYELGSGQNHLELSVAGLNGSRRLKPVPIIHAVMGVKSRGEFIPLLISHNDTES